MKKKYAMTLLEIMVVICIIGIIAGVMSFNVRGTFDKTKALTTKEGIEKIYETVQLQEAMGDSLDEDGDLAAEKLFGIRVPVC